MSAREPNRQPQIGDIYLMRFDGQGSEQKGVRPGLVFQNNTGNQFSPNIIALPLSASERKLKHRLPTHVVLTAKETGLSRDSVVLCENPERMSKERILHYITTLSDTYMAQVAAAHLIATGAIAFIDQDALINAWETARTLNTSSA